MANKNPILWLTSTMFIVAVAVYCSQHQLSQEKQVITLWAICWGVHLLFAIIDSVQKRSSAGNLLTALFFFSLGLFIGTSGFNPRFFPLQKVYSEDIEIKLYTLRICLVFLLLIAIRFRMVRNRKGNPGDELC